MSTLTGLVHAWPSGIIACISHPVAGSPDLDDHNTHLGIHDNVSSHAVQQAERFLCTVTHLILPYMTLPSSLDFEPCAVRPLQALAEVVNQVAFVLVYCHPVMFEGVPGLLSSPSRTQRQVCEDWDDQHAVPGPRRFTPVPPLVHVRNSFLLFFSISQEDTFYCGTGTACQAVLFRPLTWPTTPVARLRQIRVSPWSIDLLFTILLSYSDSSRGDDGLWIDPDWSPDDVFSVLAASSQQLLL